MLAAALFCAACQEVEINPLHGENVLSAVIEQDNMTKTVMDDNNNILWSENDQIVAFMKSSYGHKYQVKPSFVGKSYADFSMVSSGNGSDLSAGNEWDHNVAYYPYSETVSCLKSGEYYALDVVLPAEQTYVEGSFSNGSMAMVAVSEDNNITFKNVLGGMKLQLKGTLKVTSITIQGKNNEVLSGAATVIAYTDGETKPAITMTGIDSASKSVTLDCGSEGVQLNENTATEFIIALPPVVFTEGFAVIITDSEGNEQIVVTDKENKVFRSSLLMMPEVTMERVASSVDYVDEYGINHGQGIRIGETIWAPVNCGFHATDYQWGKLYQWGRKYGQGYDGDAITPTLVESSVTLDVGNNESKSNIFYTGTIDSDSDWLDLHDNTLWNAGTEEYPIKTKYDPCPEGWRVPTKNELNNLYINHSDWTTNHMGQSGYWFSGASTYAEGGAQVFLPAAGYRRSRSGLAKNRGVYGDYWSSMSYNSNTSYFLGFGCSDERYLDNCNRAYGYSIRCVRE